MALSHGGLEAEGVIMISSLLSRVHGNRESRSTLSSSESSAFSRSFEKDGYLILKSFFDETVCDGITQDAELYYSAKAVRSQKASRTMDFHQESPTAKAALNNPRLMEIIGAILGAEAVFLQSIYFNRGSEQTAHSDYIYMSTEPDFHLCGVWVACEDVKDSAGPLVYYPGSHKIPIQNVAEYYAEHIDRIRETVRTNEPELQSIYSERMQMSKESLLTCYFYDKWLNDINDSLVRGNYVKEEFLPTKGDVIIWHANLVHGGSAIKDPLTTRKSLVGHYLTKAVVKYYDMNYVDLQHYMTLESINQDRPAILHVSE